MFEVLDLCRFKPRMSLHKLAEFSIHRPPNETTLPLRKRSSELGAPIMREGLVLFFHHTIPT